MKYFIGKSNFPFGFIIAFFRSSRFNVAKKPDFTSLDSASILSYLLQDLFTYNAAKQVDFTCFDWSKKSDIIRVSFRLRISNFCQLLFH